MTDVSLTTTAAKFNANQETGSLLIGAKTTALGGIENTESVTQTNKIDTTRVSVDVHHASVDVISAAEQVKEAGSALPEKSHLVFPVEYLSFVRLRIFRSLKQNQSLGNHDFYFQMTSNHPFL